MADFSETEKVWLYVLGEMEELIVKGLVARGPDSQRLTKEGRDAFHRLKADGYRPTENEIGLIVAALKNDGPVAEE